MIGIVWFDDQNRGREGWSCNSLGKAERIQSHGDLNQSTVWITNIPRRQFDSLALNCVPYLRCNDYLKSRLDHISDEMGLTGVSPKQRVIALFSIVNKTVVRLGKKLPLPPSLPSYRFHEAFSDQIILDSFREKPTCKDQNASLIEYIFSNATQYNQASSGRQLPKGSKACRFRFVRGPYYRYLAEQDCPANNNWIYKTLNTSLVIGHNANGPVASHKSAINKLMKYKEEHFCFVQIEVQKCDPNFSQFYTFGVSGFTNKVPRRWASLDEVIEIATFSQIKVLSILYTEKTSISQFLKFDPLLDGCYSEGLYRETLYKSFMEHPNTTKTALSACLSSHERILSGKVATTFFNAGFTIGSFGSGLVTLYLRGISDPNNFSNQAVKAVQLGLSLGLIPSADFIPSAKSSEAIQFNLSSAPLPAIEQGKLQYFISNPFMRAIRNMDSDSFDMPILIERLESVFREPDRQRLLEKIKAFGDDISKTKAVEEA